MPDSLYRRLTRYAAYAAVHLPAAIFLLSRTETWALVTLAVISVPFLFDIGPFHADLAMNESIGAAERTRWRVALFLVPWSISAYWHVWVRPLRNPS